MPDRRRRPDMRQLKPGGDGPWNSDSFVTRPVRPTAAGGVGVAPARLSMTSAAQAEQAVHHTRDVLIGTLRLGVALSAQHLVPFASYLGEFTRDHPGIDLRLQYAPALTMISMVETGELDWVI